MTSFLEIIGGYNLLGSLVLLAMLHPAVANTLLHALPASWQTSGNTPRSAGYGWPGPVRATSVWDI